LPKTNSRLPFHLPKKGEKRKKRKKKKRRKRKKGEGQITFRLTYKLQ
jgi:hypothetical protein